MKPAFLSEREVEDRAVGVLQRYELQSGGPVSIPVPIEHIIEVTLDTYLMWESITPVRGNQLAGKFVQPTPHSPARIVLNQDLLDTVFAATPGFERTTLGHEAGHAALHREAHRSQQLRLDMLMNESPQEIAIRADMVRDGLSRAIELRGPDGDEYWREWQAYTFMRYILMPRQLLAPLLIGDRFLTWAGTGGLYDLRDRLGVTISALVVHLSKFGLISVDEHKQISDRRSRAIGQRALVQ